MSRLRRVIEELKRRGVFRVAVVYAAAAFVIWQAADFALPAARLPDWAPTLVLVLTILGFPIAIVLAWAFDITPGGVVRTQPEDAVSAVPEGPTPTVEAPAKTSIVVLPFDNLSPDPGDAYFSGGLTEEIITDLSYVRSVRVISRSSAMALKGTQKDVRTIGKELGVQYVLEGSVRKAGNDLRITAQLIDATTDEHLWAERYSGQLEDVFDMQEKVSRAIVDALKLQISPQEDRRIAQRPIENVQAYQCYLRARQAIWLWTEEALDRATQYLEEALDVIGDNAFLYAGMAYVCAQYANLGAKQEEYIDKAEGYARKALGLDAESPEAHVVLGLVYQAFRGDQRQSFHHLRRALATDPDDPEALFWLIVGHTYVANTDEAYALAERLEKVDPLNPLTRGRPGLPGFLDMIMKGRFDRGVEAMADYYRIEPQNPMAIFWYALTLVYCQQFEEMRTLVDENVPADRGDVYTGLSLFLRSASLGETDRIEDLMTSEFTRTIRRDAQLSWLVSSFYALAGQKQEALDWLENAVDRGFINYRFLAECDPLIAKLRAEPRLQQLLERVKYEWEDFNA